MNGKGSRAATGNTDDADDDGGWKDGRKHSAVGTHVVSSWIRCR